MTLQPAGTTLNYRVTYLEMRERPEGDYPRLPIDMPASLLCAERPPAWYFLSLYDAVGRDYAWEDMHESPEADLDAWLSDSQVALWSLMRAGWPQGFFVLDARRDGETDLAYFGLVPQAVGRGLGSFLMRTAILTAWERPGLKVLKVNTCSLDHPRALAGYQKNGFEVVAQEHRTRVLRRARDLSRIPD